MEVRQRELGTAQWVTASSVLYRPPYFTVQLSFPALLQAKPDFPSVIAMPGLGPAILQGK